MPSLALPTAAAVEQYLHEHIPLSAAMEVSVVAVDESGVRLAAPLAPNINHRQTVFGGSASALAILSAWALVHVRLTALEIPARIVIQRNEVEFLAPMTTDFEAFCPTPSEEEWQRFLTLLRRRGKGRLRLTAELQSGGEIVGTFTGEYVALG
jgi:thioesterase domain-containing protein